MDIRAEIARVSAEHDKLMREDAQWLAHREAERKALMRESDDEDLLYRTTEQNAQASAARTDSVPSDGEADDDELDPYTKGIVEFTCEYVRQKLEPRDKRIARLETQVEMLITLLGKSGKFTDSKSADVTELPRGFLRRVHNG